MATKTEKSQEKSSRHTVVMTKRKETKGTVVYGSEDDHLKTVYVGKKCFKPMPDEITVILKVGKGSE